MIIQKAEGGLKIADSHNSNLTLIALHTADIVSVLCGYEMPNGMSVRTVCDISKEDAQEIVDFLSSHFNIKPSQD